MREYCFFEIKSIIKHPNKKIVFYNNHFHCFFYKYDSCQLIKLSKEGEMKGEISFPPMKNNPCWSLHPFVDNETLFFQATN